MTPVTVVRRASRPARVVLALALAGGSFVPAFALAPRAQADDSTALGSPTVTTEQFGSGDRYDIAAAISRRISIAL